MDAGVGNWTLDGDDNAKLPELLKAAAVLAAGIRPRIMYLDAIYSLVIGFVGAILFVLVDKYEPDGRLDLWWRSCTDRDHTDLRCFSQRECGAFPPSLGARPALPPPAPTGSITSLTRKMAEGR